MSSEFTVKGCRPGGQGTPTPRQVTRPVLGSGPDSAPLPLPPRRRPQAEAAAWGGSRGGGAGSQRCAPKPSQGQPRALTSTTRPLAGDSRWAPLHCAGESGAGWPSPTAPQGPGQQAGAGASLRHRPPGPPPPARPNSTPREGGADKGSGPRLCPRPARPPSARPGRGYIRDYWDLDRPRRILRAAAAVAVAKGGDARRSATRAAVGTQSGRPSGIPSYGTLPRAAPRLGRRPPPFKGAAGTVSTPGRCPQEPTRPRSTSRIFDF